MFYDSTIDFRRRCRHPLPVIGSPQQKADTMTKHTSTILSVLLLTGAAAFAPSTLIVARHRNVKCMPVLFYAPEKKPIEPRDFVAKVPWYAVESFGKVFGSKVPKNEGSETSGFALDRPPSSFKETQGRIKLDNQREYFLSGQVDKLIYSDDCTFSDPFVSFQGRDRFVENLSNLGSFISSYSARPLDYRIDEDSNTVTTKFMVKLQLNLPWKPILAWPWGVQCEIDPQTNLIVVHEESVSALLVSVDHPNKQNKLTGVYFHRPLISVGY